jgi:RNA polymerase sigma-70 factor (ECF subfamily)
LEISTAVTERTNEAWLRDLAEGSPNRDAALEALRARLQRGLFYYLSRERSDLADRTPEELQQMAEDFAQEALLRILANLDSFRGDSQFTTWATKIAVRLVVSELRRLRYRDFSLDSLVDGDENRGADTSALASAGADGPERSAEKREVWRRIEHALSEALTPRQRAAFEALILDGVPLDIVAGQLNTNRNALYKLIFDARRKLRQHLEAQGLSPEYILKLFES